MPKHDGQKIRELAEQLKGTTHSVYEVAPSVLGVKSVGSSVYKDLDRDGRVFQCETCDFWKDVADRSEILTPEHAEQCRDCASQTNS